MKKGCLFFRGCDINELELVGFSVQMDIQMANESERRDGGQRYAGKCLRICFPGKKKKTMISWFAEFASVLGINAECEVVLSYRYNKSK